MQLFLKIFVFPIDRQNREIILKPVLIMHINHIEDSLKVQF